MLLTWDENPSAAARWFNEAADQGDNEARRSLGYLYAEGIGVQKDVSRAEALFRTAAQAGDATASYNLGVLYLEEEGFSSSQDEVIALLVKGADAGIDDAAAKLGDLHSRRNEDAAALEWYERAAELGHSAAMFAAGTWRRDAEAQQIIRMRRDGSTGS